MEKIYILYKNIQGVLGIDAVFTDEDAMEYAWKSIQKLASEDPNNVEVSNIKQGLAHQLTFTFEDKQFQYSILVALPNVCMSSQEYAEDLAKMLAEGENDGD